METILFDIATPVSVIRGCHIIKKRVKLSKEETKVLDKHLLSNIKIVEKKLCKLLRYSVS